VDIVIPDPSLVVLVGPAGAGKSTFAARHFDPTEILSSDAFRAWISGDATDQSATRAAFGRLHRELARRLEAGRLSVVDATNIERAARLALIRRSAAAGLPTVAIVFDLPPEVVLARNAARIGRVVDESIVRLHLARLRLALDGLVAPIATEGLAEIVVLRDQREIDAIRVVRRIG
jgi:protein phosphatase